MIRHQRKLNFLFYFNNNQKVTEADNDKVDVRSHLEQHMRNQETKDSVWRFGEIKSMTN